MASMKKTTKVDVATIDTTVEELTTEDVAKEVREAPVVTLKEKRKFKDTDTIECVSITAGELGMIGIKSKINYTWAGRGDVTEVEYQDLVAAIRSSKKHIYKPYFIIQDEDFLEQYPQVKKVYANMYSIADLQEVFNLSPANMKTVITSLPDGAKESIKHIASSMISTGKLDSVQKIKILDEIFDTKFMMMTELFG